MDDYLFFDDLDQKIQLSNDFYAFVENHPELSDLWTLPGIYDMYGIYN